VRSKRRKWSPLHKSGGVGRQVLPIQAGKKFAGVTGAVQTLYEEYPYPQYRQLFVCPDAAASTAYLAHRCFRPEPFRPRRILVAGCGTTHAVSLAASNPTAVVLGVDISRSSLQIAERMGRDLGVANLDLHQEDILSFSGHDGEFDLIDCYGVLHHTADPSRGLRNLARALAPDGLVSVMVYSQRVRHEIGEFQQVFRMLNRVRERQGGDSTLATRMAFAHHLGEVLAASGSRLNVVGRKASALYREDRTQFADTYVQPREVRYRLDEVLGLVREAGLSLVNFIHEREWEPGAYLDDPEILARVRTLPREEIWRFCDVIGSPFYHFLCAHPTDIPTRTRPCLENDAAVMTIVPRPCSVRSYPLRNNRAEGPPFREPREGCTFVRRGDRIRFRGSFGELDAPPISLDYIRLADGERTVEEIALAAAFRQGMVALPSQAEVAAAFRALFGMTPFLTPDTAQCHGCPLRHESPRRMAAATGVA